MVVAPPIQHVHPVRICPGTVRQCISLDNVVDGARIVIIGDINGIRGLRIQKKRYGNRHKKQSENKFAHVASPSDLL